MLTLDSKTEGKVMMCEACDHVFDFPGNVGQVKPCPMCRTRLFRARRHDLIATRHDLGDHEREPQLAEVIRPKFERRLLNQRVSQERVEEVRKKVKTIQVCDKCLTIQEVVPGETEQPCPSCHPSNKPSAPVSQDDPSPPHNLDSEFVAIDIEEDSPAINKDEPPPTDAQDVIVPIKQGKEFVSLEELQTEPNQDALYELGKGNQYGPASAIPSIISFSNHEWTEAAFVANMPTSTSTELSTAYEQIKLPKITGSLVENDSWMNYRKETFKTKVKDHLFIGKNAATKAKAEDSFVHQVRHILVGYALVGICLIGTLGVVIWSLFNQFD